MTKVISNFSSKNRSDLPPKIFRNHTIKVNFRGQFIITFTDCVKIKEDYIFVNQDIEIIF